MNKLIMMKEIADELLDIAKTLPVLPYPSKEATELSSIQNTLDEVTKILERK